MFERLQEVAGMRRIYFAGALLLFLLAGFRLQVHAAQSEQVQVGLPQVRVAEPPDSAATADALERRGDELRGGKFYLDAVDYYRAALKKDPNNARVFNKMGIAYLQLHRYEEAQKEFERSIKKDRGYANAYNNLGVIYYHNKKYSKAISLYAKAINLNHDSASFYSNMGTAYFAKKEFEEAMAAYGQAMKIDPNVFESTSRTGVAGYISSPEDRARWDYVLAKLWAKAGDNDRCLEALRRAMEDGYKNIDEVYKDEEFAGLRKDPRFAELMASRPPGIPE
jgi:tetratricopeptide (TPR) repeat protein